MRAELKKKRMGHQVTVWTPERIAEVVAMMDEYTESNQVPILAEFAYKHKLSRQSMYEITGLSDAIKRMTTKKEAELEKGALSGQLNVTMAIFSLKQMGWKDKTEVEVAEKRPVYLNGKLMQIVGNDAD